MIDGVDDVVAERLALLELAESLGNVMAACQRFSVTRKTYYKYRKRYAQHGLDGLRNLPPIAKSHPATAGDAEIALIRTLALRHPALGCDRLHALLSADDRRAWSSSAIQKHLARMGLATQRSRWLALEAYARDRALTAEQTAFVAKHNPCFRERERMPASCGVLLSQDVQLLGRVEPLGPIFLHSVIDHYSGYTFALVYAAKRPEAAIALLYQDVLPYYDRLGLRPHTIQTHRGREFCGSSTHPYPLYLALNGIEHQAVAAMPGSGFTQRLHAEVRRSFIAPYLRSSDGLVFGDLQQQFAAWLARFNDEMPFAGFPNDGQPPAARMPVH